MTDFISQYTYGNIVSIIKSLLYLKGGDILSFVEYNWIPASTEIRKSIHDDDKKWKSIRVTRKKSYWQMKKHRMQAIANIRAHCTVILERK